MSGRQRYEYDEALALAENLMQKTLIRKYCQTICKGYCCTNLLGECGDKACLRGKRKLMCSIYVCDELLKILNTPAYYRETIVDLELEWRKKIKTHPYYAPVRASDKEKFKPQKAQIDRILKALGRRRIRIIMRYLILRKIKAKDIWYDNKTDLIRRQAFRFHERIKK